MSAMPPGAGPTRRERRAAGRALRRDTPRTSHAVWAPPADRADPVAILQAQGRSRIAALLPIRYGRMQASPLAFLRGAAAVMAADLARTKRAGFVVQSCGDCHLANFGSFATPEGRAVFDINDFDETLPAPFEWDLKRLGTSLVLSGRQAGLSAHGSRALARDATRAYVAEIARLAPLSPVEAWAERIDLVDAIETIADPRARRRARQTLAERLRSQAIGYGLVETRAGGMPGLREAPPLAVRLPEHEDDTRLAFARYVASLPPDRALLLRRYRLVDVLFKVVGIGSVGTFCAIGLFATPDGEKLLLQIKQAQASVLEPFAGRSGFAACGERVVIGQRTMQAASDAFLGWTSAGDRHFYVRRLKDARLASLGLKIEQHGLHDYALLCGKTLGRAHARSADIAGLSGYLGRGRAFSRAIADFSVAYADQTGRDWSDFVRAIDAGRVPATEA